MNDETLDELLSAAIDGEATPEELALIAETPGADQRMRELRSAADSVSALMPRVPSQKRQVMIAAAVDAFVPSETALPETEPPAKTSTGPSNVIPLQPRWARLRSGSAVAGGIAASIVAMGLLASVIGSSVNTASRHGATSSAEAASTAAPAATTAATEQAVAESADGPAIMSGGLDDAEAPAEAVETTMASTTLEMAATTIQASDLDEESAAGTFGRQKQALLCWETISEQFPDHLFDESADPFLEDGSLAIPTIDSSGNHYLISVDEQTCIFLLLVNLP